MQHNEDLCVVVGCGSQLQGIDINKHMQCTDIRELLYIAENSKALLLLQGFFPQLKIIE